MDLVELTKGQGYQIQTTDENSFPNKSYGIYVRREEFQKSRTIWETFYRFLGGTNLVCSEGVANMDGILQRIRIPAESIQRVEENVIYSDGEIVIKLVQDPDNRPPVVYSWLKEIQDMQQSQ
jgi:hypothetical protein